jgi:hypothetical protein
MRFTAYYVVHAREGLLARLKDSPGADLFREVALWSSEEGGRTAYGPVEWTECFKLTYLLKLQVDYLAEKPETADQEQFQGELRSILGPKPWGVEVFDRWWTAERLDGVAERAEAVWERASAGDVEGLRGADEWRAWLIRHITAVR